MIINALTFELRIFLRKKRTRVEQLKKGYKRKLYFCVPAQEAKSGQPLAPILGQVQINTFDFCTNFNTKTKEYPKGLIIFVELLVKWDKTYELNLKPFPLFFFIKEYLFIPFGKLSLTSDTNFCISLSDFYKVVLLYQTLTGNKNIKACVKSVFSTLFCYKIQVMMHTEQQILDSLQKILTSHIKPFLLLEHNVKGFGTSNYNIQTSYNLLTQQFENVETP
jgi:ribosomal protein L11